VHDLTKDPIGYGIRPSTAIQVKQMEFITNYNKALPKRKQNQAIPMIQSTNIGVLNTLKKDQKKGTTEIMTKFTPIGMVDDFQDANECDKSKFSLQGKARHLSVQSARQKIQNLRKLSGNLINTTAITEEQN
jgi:hypothetical protein